MNNNFDFDEILAAVLFFVKLFFIAVILPFLSIIPTAFIHTVFHLSVMGIVFWLLAFYIPMFCGSYWVYNQFKNNFNDM